MVEQLSNLTGLGFDLQIWGGGRCVWEDTSGSFLAKLSHIRAL